MAEHMSIDLSFAASPGRSTILEKPGALSGAPRSDTKCDGRAELPCEVNLLPSKIANLCHS